MFGWPVYPTTNFFFFFLLLRNLRFPRKAYTFFFCEIYEMASRYPFPRNPRNFIDFLFFRLPLSSPSASLDCKQLSCGYIE